jgi:hypothetical protein
MRRLASALLVSLALGCSPIEPPVIDASALPNTTDTTGPYEVTARVQARRSIEAVTLVWRDLPADAIDAKRLPMTQDSAGVYHASIPGQGVGAQIAFHVEATDSAGDTSAAPVAGSTAQCGDEYCFDVLSP